ncbi:hypothetical protein HUO13_01050 [Saccharopolyspora erythraea]|uniref:hypothetical protein n=1 Tax=Saccharopolyspora erythraea TaxID=1836 RepID=UPI001BAE4B88|nr:hypothetical protein [Saccharopolyspora erythraea]QUG99574.1 hypothetical protein HUO13_01050 [Saccharopolyspora erythraea]
MQPACEARLDVDQLALITAAWFAVTFVGLSAQLPVVAIQTWQQVCCCVSLPAAVGAVGAGGSRQTARNWLRSLQFRFTPPDSRTSSSVADARRLARLS